MKVKECEEKGQRVGGWRAKSTGTTWDRKDRHAGRCKSDICTNRYLSWLVLTCLIHLDEQIMKHGFLYRMKMYFRTKNIAQACKRSSRKIVFQILVGYVKFNKSMWKTISWRVTNNRYTAQVLNCALYLLFISLPNIYTLFWALLALFKLSPPAREPTEARGNFPLPSHSPYGSIQTLPAPFLPPPCLF